MRVLVAAASRHGSTTEIAQAIGAELAKAGLEPTVMAADRVLAVADYDAVVLGSGVYAGRWLDAARKLADREQAALVARPVWLFSSGPIGDPAKPTGDPAEAAAMVEKTRARGHATFSGRLDKGELSFAERAITRVVGASEGDYREWPRIREWAAEIATALKPAAATPAV